MEIKDMLAVLEAAKRGEKIELQTDPFSDCWQEWKGTVIHLDLNYRIAPKPQMTLVERLRDVVGSGPAFELCRLAADRIEDLENYEKQCKTLNYLPYVQADILLAEIARRVK